MPKTTRRSGSGLPARPRIRSRRAGGFSLVETGDDRLYACQRCSSEECILLVVNLSEEEIGEYALQMAEESHVPMASPEDLLSDRRAAPLSVRDYRPMSVLEPMTGYLFR